MHAHLFEGPDHVGLAAAARGAVLNDPATAELIARLPEWNSVAEISGHQHPAFAPKLLGLLADMGVVGGDDEQIEHLLDTMVDHQLPDGRFAVAATSRAASEGGVGGRCCATPTPSPRFCCTSAAVTTRVWGGRCRRRSTIWPARLRAGMAVSPRRAERVPWARPQARPVPAGDPGGASGLVACPVR